MKFLKTFSGLVLSVVMAFISCETPGEDMDTLSVEPSSTVILKAKAVDNQDVLLSVATNVADWDFTAPDFVKAVKEGNTLVVNAKGDNSSGDPLLGRITFSAGAAEPVSVTVMQEGGVVVANTVVSLVNKSGTDSFRQLSRDRITASVNISLKEALSADAEVEIYVDAGYLKEYNYNEKKECLLFPESAVGLPSGKKVTIPAGQVLSGDIEITLDPETLEYGKEYLVPLRVKTVSDNVTVDKAAMRVNYVTLIQTPKTIRNIVFFEVNETNPLNALEYVLEDGKMFFDAVVLFAANINYDADNDLVYLHNNPNVQALLDGTETYIQPLRKAGIKVYLGLLGNHDEAGIAQLSPWGAQHWAAEVAEAVREYKLDGVNLDDEFSKDPIIGNKWFAEQSSEAAARLAYELKMAMKDACDWDTEVSYFAFNTLSQVEPVTLENGDVRQPSEFLDFWVGNYDQATKPVGGLTLQNCSANSVELNEKKGPIGTKALTVEQAKKYKDQGYGYFMWFAFEPNPNGNIYNLQDAMPVFRTAAKGFYGMDLLDPEGYYTKGGQGIFSPDRQEF